MGVNEAILGDLAELFKVFGDETRVRILLELLEGEKNVGDIVQNVAVSQPTVSHQLRILKQAKLVKARRDGKSMYYSLDDDHVRTIINVGMEHLME
ncbi:MAG: winged helix-turn-helix transcriptional regulator [Firmicutes bacterium]|nr:winged helix-turn-helix transcriptional regulator [Bacillota bacterium]MBR2575810.1 winged helix-turn-helix transcriptional regulator [Bacillota bacterium]